MSFFIGLLTAVLVMTSVALIFLILIQLPKKEAGMGVAFGAGATDALFGAGSGSNALTKLTRYSTILFLTLSLIVSILITRQARTSNPNFGSAVDKAAIPNAQPQLPGPNSQQLAPELPTNAGAATAAAPRLLLEEKAPAAKTNQP